MRHSQTRLMTAAMVAAAAMASHDLFFNHETKQGDPPANSFAKTKKNQRRKKRNSK